MTPSGNAKAWLGIPSSHPAVRSNGYRILATGRPASTCAALGSIQNSASCAEVPSTNRQFETLIGLLGSRVRLCAGRFGKTSSREIVTFLPDRLRPECQVSNLRGPGCVLLLKAPGSRFLRVLTGYKRQPGAGAGRS